MAPLALPYQHGFTQQGKSHAVSPDPVGYASYTHALPSYPTTYGNAPSGFAHQPQTSYMGLKKDQPGLPSTTTGVTRFSFYAAKPWSFYSQVVLILPSMLKWASRFYIQQDLFLGVLLNARNARESKLSVKQLRLDEIPEEKCCSYIHRETMNWVGVHCSYWVRTQLYFKKCLGYN